MRTRARLWNRSCRFEYEHVDLAQDIAYLAPFPQAATAQELGITERGWRKILKGDVTPLPQTAGCIRDVAATYRARSRG